MRERGAFSVDETAGSASQCCAGLAHAHELGIVHRDLSPENVMLTRSSSGVRGEDHRLRRRARGASHDAARGATTGR